MGKNIFYVMSLLWSMSAFTQTGGPDAAGYSYISSDAVSGPIYNWIELDTTLGGTGTPSTANGVFDGHQTNIPLGFTFPFYGKNYNSLAIHSNGTVYFEDINLTWANVCMPGDPVIGFSGDTAIIATVWQALTVQGSGALYYQDFGTSFVIEYSDVPEWGGTDGDTWELILHEDGDIVMQFKETSLSSTWGAHTTGIQGSPTVGLEYQCNGGGDPIHDSLAILFTNPFIGIQELAPLDLSIYPNPTNGEFEIHFSSMVNGTYTVEVRDLGGSLCYSNSFKNSTGHEQISLKNSAPGVYFVRLVDGQNSVIKKVILR